jgi:hypothetical protein
MEHHKGAADVRVRTEAQRMVIEMHDVAPNRLPGFDNAWAEIPWVYLFWNFLDLAYGTVGESSTYINVTVAI